MIQWQLDIQLNFVLCLDRAFLLRSWSCSVSIPSIVRNQTTRRATTKALAQPRRHVLCAHTLQKEYDMCLLSNVEEESDGFAGAEKIKKFKTVGQIQEIIRSDLNGELTTPTAFV